MLVYNRFIASSALRNVLLVLRFTQMRSMFVRNICQSICQDENSTPELVLDNPKMNSRLLFYPLRNICRVDLRLFRPRVISRSQSSTQLTSPTRRWAIRRYVLLVGLPLTSYLVYRLSTKSNTRRKHIIVLGSVGRAIR